MRLLTPSFLAALLAVAPTALHGHPVEPANTRPLTEVEIPDTSALIPSGWRETVVSVRDVDQMVAFYTGTLGWELRTSGKVDRAMLEAWGLPPEASARFALVANPGSDHGFVRIVSFKGVEQRRIREHDVPWDTGGIFNMNIRVADMDQIEREATDAGWQGISRPVTFTFGPFVVSEWIPRTSDGVRIAFIKRHSPPLEGWPNLTVTSRTFNSTQIVADLNEALQFYQGVLGFHTTMTTRGPSAEPGEYVLGLSREAMVEITREVRIVSPADAGNDGSIELLEFEGYTGRDFSDHARPPNLGNLMLRFPVPDVDALVAYLRARGVTPEYAPVETEVRPYGPVKITAIRAPDGAWLEFFQTLN